MKRKIQFTITLFLFDFTGIKIDTIMQEDMTTVAMMTIEEKFITMEQEDIMTIMGMRFIIIAKNTPTFIIATTIILMNILITMLIILEIITIMGESIFLKLLIKRLCYKISIFNFLTKINFFRFYTNQQSYYNDDHYYPAMRRYYDGFDDTWTNYYKDDYDNKYSTGYEKEYLPNNFHHDYYGRY